MRIVIAGAGPAGVTVAETLRQHGSQAEVVMLTDEPYPPYSPPAMVTYFETGEPIHFWRGQDLAQQLHLVYRPGTRLVGVEPALHRLRLADGEMLAYDRLAIATGARLYTPLEGSDKPGVYNFKSLSAAEELLGQIRSGQARTALVVGAGFIGVEIALLLAGMGVAVTQLVRSRVMRSMLDAETSEFVLGMMQQRGIAVVRGTDADALAFLGEPRALAVQMRSGSELTADLFVAATGLRPNIEFLAGSGIETGWGVRVDEHLRSSDPDIYAAGDVAESSDRSGARRVHAIFPNAIEQGRVVGLNLLGQGIVYEEVDDMNSLKHLGLPIMAAGKMEGEELRASQAGTLRKVYLQDGRIAGFCLAGDIRGAGIYLGLLKKRENVAALKHRLLDPGFGMGYIAGSPV